MSCIEKGLMNILFHDKKTYTYRLPPDVLRYELINLSRDNLSASLPGDDSFIVETKFVLANLFWPEFAGSFVTLRGKIEKQHNQTIITTVVRPNYYALAILALLLLVMLLSYVGKPKPGILPEWIIHLTTSTLFGIALFFGVRSLRRRFEKVFRLS